MILIHTPNFQGFCVPGLSFSLTHYVTKKLKNAFLVNCFVIHRETLRSVCKPGRNAFVCISWSILSIRVVKKMFFFFNLNLNLWYSHHSNDMYDRL